MSKFKITDRKKALMWVVYLLLLGQLLFSTFVATLGPSYTFDYQNFNARNCATANIGGLGSNCVINCPGMAPFPHPQADTPPRGFPITLYYSTDDLCYGTASIPTDDFALAVTLDVLYITVVTAVFGYLLRRLGKGPKKTARRRNR